MPTLINLDQLSQLSGIPVKQLHDWQSLQLFSSCQQQANESYYTQETVILVRQIHSYLQDGLTLDEIEQWFKNSGHDPGTQPDAVDHIWTQYRNQLLQAIEQFDDQAMETCYNHALSLYPFSVVSSHLILPTLQLLGSRWDQRDTGIAEEHFFSVYLRNKLGALLHHSTSQTFSRRLLVACLPEEHHEIGALLFTIAALGYGYRALFLGANTPLQQLTAVSQKVDVSAMVLSGTYVSLDAVDQAWKHFIPATDIPIFIGGPFAERHTQWIDCHHINNLGCDTETALENIFELIPPFNLTKGSHPPDQLASNT